MENTLEKLYKILLIPVLIAGIGLAGFVGYRYYQENKAVQVPDLSKMTPEEIYAWCGSLNTSYSCEIDTEKSRTVKENGLISQEPTAGGKLVDKVVIKISSGLIPQVSLPDLSGSVSQDSIKAWASENKIENITYVEEENDKVDNGCVIRVEPSQDLYADTPITVYISKNDPKIKPNEYGEIEIKSGQFIGETVSRFESITRNSGLKPTHNTNRDAYSDAVAKGNVVSHGYGIYEKDEAITYGISLGKKEGSSTSDEIVVKQNAYVGLSESDFTAKAKELGLTPKHLTDRDDYSDNVAKGKVLTHGYGTYEKNEDFNYGLSLGKKDGSSTTDEIVVKQNAYMGLSESDFIAKAKELGLTPKHLTDRDDYSDNVAKGKVLTHGYGTYEKNEAFNYGLSLGKKDGSSTTDEITVKQNEYVGLSESDFIAKAKQLGLTPKHLTDRDNYSDTVAKGKVLTHGYGTYEKNEDFNYGLSLGKKEDSSTTDEIKVTANQYVGNTVSDFETKIKALKLTPFHDTTMDAYSDTVTKGNVVWHGSGTYTTGEKMRYGVSLGKQEITTVSVGNYAGKNESELTSFLSQNGLVGKKTEQYSDSVASGKIISNDTGTKKKGDTVNYVVSKGAEPVQTATLASFVDINNRCFVTGDANKASENVKSFLSNAGFTNYQVVFSSSRDDGVGVLMSITVNGTNHVSAKSYPVNSAIVVTICNAEDNG